MIARSTIDIHAHILTDETMKLLAKISPRVAPIMTDIGHNSAAVMEINGKVMQKPVPRGLWDVEWRLREMDENDVDIQLLLPATQTFYYEEEAKLAAACAALQNEPAFSVAVLDIGMDGNGREADMTIAALLQERGTPFVFLTGMGSDDARARKFPEAPLVDKPFQGGELLAAVRRALRQR